MEFKGDRYKNVYNFKSGDIVRNRLRKDLFVIENVYDTTKTGYGYEEETVMMAKVSYKDPKKGEPFSDYIQNFYPLEMSNEEKKEQLSDVYLKSLIMTSVKYEFDDYKNTTGDKIQSVTLDFDNNVLEVTTKDLGKITI